MRPTVPLAGAAVVGVLVVASSAGAVAGRDLLETSTSNETSATAQSLVLGETVAQQVVLGPPSVRDEDWFVARGRPGSLVTVSLVHAGDVARRGLVLELSRVTSTAPRWWKVASGGSAVARARLGVDGRLLLHVRCAGSETVGPCASLGAIPYRLRVVAGRRAARPAAANGPATAAPSPTPSPAPSPTPTLTNPTAPVSPAAVPAATVPPVVPPVTPPVSGGISLGGS